MKVAAFGLLLTAGLVFSAFGLLQAQTPPGSSPAKQSAVKHEQGLTPSDQLIALTTDGATGVQQVTLVDPKARTMSVYHVEKATGKITLMSVRNVHWDLLMDEFNGESPSPREIRSLLQRK